MIINFLRTYHKQLRAFSRQLINQFPQILKIYKIQLFSRNSNVKFFANHGYFIVNEYISKEHIKKALFQEGLQNILMDVEKSGMKDKDTKEKLLNYCSQRELMMVLICQSLYYK